MKIYVKRAGEELSALKPAITLGSTIPEDVPANNLVLTDGEGGVQNSGVNIDNIDAKTLDGKNSSYYAQKTQIDNILDGTTKVAKAVAADSATSATSASKLSTSAGTATNPVYFKDGVPVATTYALNKTVPSDAKFTDTVYTHPSSHAATMITEDSTHRFVTDAEKTTWNGALSSAKSYTDTKISALIGSAPETLDTLKEIADAITDNQEVIDTLNSAIGNKADGTNGVANNASKLNGQAASYYATAASVTNIVNGTTQVGSAAKVGTIAASSVAEKTWVEDYVTEKMADTGVGDMLASVYDVDGDGTVDDADKLGGQLPSYYAKASDLTTVTSNITKIVDGTTKVAKAIAADSATSATKATQDGNGKVIADTYATVTALNTTNTNVTNITNGTTKVAKATAADSATKATQDASGNVITSTYATKSALDTTNANITKITDGTTTVAKATSATKATQDGNGNVIASTYLLKSGDSMTGTLRYDTNAETTFIKVGVSDNKNATLLRVASGLTNSDTGTSYYGYSIKYMGAGNGNDNALAIFTDNQLETSQIKAVNITQDGAVAFNNKVTAGTFEGTNVTTTSGVINYSSNASIKYNDTDKCFEFIFV